MIQFMISPDQTRYDQINEKDQFKLKKQSINNSWKKICINQSERKSEDDYELPLEWDLQELEQRRRTLNPLPFENRRPFLFPVVLLEDWQLGGGFSFSVS